MGYPATRRKKGFNRGVPEHFQIVGKKKRKRKYRLLYLGKTSNGPSKNHQNNLLSVRILRIYTWKEK